MNSPLILPKFRKNKKAVFEKVIETGQFIHFIGENDDLRKPSSDVPVEKIKTKEYKEKFKYLKNCMLRYRKLTGVGRGITAVQIGIPERFSVVYMPELKGRLLIIINPKITKKSKELLKYPEMCMSANPIIAPLARPSWIEFEYYDEEGIKRYWKKKSGDKKGKMYNRVFQHEIDHMDGTINIDKIDSRSLIFELDPAFYDKAKFEKA
ncbi:MAG: peptide deformylase [Patescibacteria group bacterium]|nr:peptide deformylase [Patescibacteria group bacterium]